MTRTLLRARTAVLITFALIISLVIGTGGVAVAATGPQAPSNVTAIPGTSAPYGSVVVSWTAPKTMTGITAFQASASGKTCKTSNAKTFTCTISGLAGGTPVFPSVVSLAGKVASAKSTAPVAATPYGNSAPSSVTTPVLQLTGARSISVAWTVANSGPPVTSAAVLLNPAIGTCDGSTSPARCTGLSPNTQYSISVRATNPVGATTSSTATITPLDLPLAPTDVTISATRSGGNDDQALITWSNPPTNLPSSAFTYSAIATRIGGSGSAQCTASSSAFWTPSASCTILHLAPSVAYSLVVKAKNAVGEAVSAPAKTFTGPAQVPGSASITSVNAQGSGTNGSLAVTWVAPISLNGAVLTGYKVSAVDSTNGTQAAPTDCPVGPTVLNCTLTGVKVADAYTVTVEVDTQDQTDPLNPIDLTPVKTTQLVPGAPTSIAVKSQASGLQISWSNVGSADRYVIQATDGSTGITTTATSGSKSATLQVESPNHPFAVTVQAITGNANGITSTPALVPAAPESLITTVGAEVGSGALKITWSNSASLPTPDSYLVTIKPTNAGISPSSCNITYASSPVCTFSGLSNGTTYTVEVASTIGNLANVATTSAIPYGVPDRIARPSIEVLPSDAGGQLTVSWFPPNSNGSPITGYRITATEVTTPPALASVTTKSFSGTCSSKCATSIIGLLKNASAYTVTVTATNGPGSTSPVSDASNSATPFSRPGKVTAPKLTVQPDGSMSLDWCAPVDSGWGSPIFQYEILTTNSSLGTQPFLVTPHATAKKVGACADSYHYDFSSPISITSPPAVTISARNGSPSPAPVSKSSETINPAGAPRNGVVTAGIVAGSGALTVSWSAPGVDGYIYTAKAFLGANQKGSCQQSDSPTSCTIAGLNNGVAYSIQVTADSTTESSTAAFGNAVPYTRPDAPVLKGLTRDTVDNDITFNISWSDGVSNGGRTLESYSCSLIAIVPNGNTTSMVPVTGQPDITGIPTASPQCSFENQNAPKARYQSDCAIDISFGCRYKIQVSTFNGPGSSTKATSTEVTPPTEPNAPTITSIKDGNGSADLNFNWSQVDTGGMPIILFSVYAVDSTDTQCIGAFDPAGSIPPACSVFPCVTLPDANSAVNGGATTCHVANLNNGMSYRFIIRAKNSVGWSTWSSWSTDIAQPVGGPTGGIVKISAASKTIVVSIGTDPDLPQFSVNNADLLSGFRLTISTSCTSCVTPNNPAENCTAFKNAPSPSASDAVIAARRSFLASPTCTINNLSDGIDYTYVVTVSDTWTGAPNSVVPEVFDPVTATPNGPPGTPTNLGVTTGPDNTLDVSFGPANANGGIITGYQVQVTTSSPDLPGTFGCNGGSVTPDNTGMTCEVVGLVPGLAYNVQVFAVSANGLSAAPATAVYTLGVASPPTNVVAQSVNRQILISWNPGSLDGFPITSYVARIGNSGRTCTTTGDRTKLISGDPTALAPGLSCAIPVTCTAIASPCSFSVQVASVTSVTNPLTNVVTDVPSAYASADDAVLVVAPPTAPRNVVVYNQPNALIVRWSPPSNIGLGMTFYRVQATAPGVSPSPACVSVAKPGGGTCALQIKKPGAYSVSVTPYDTAGPGTPYSETASTGTLPWAPQNLQAFPDDSGVTLSWSSGSTSLTGFTPPTVTGYQCSIVGSNLSPAAQGSSSCSFTGLDPNKSYVFTVVSYQSAGTAKVVCIDAPTISMKPIKFSTLGTPSVWDGGKFAAPSGAAFSPDGQVLYTIDAGVVTNSGTGIIKVTKAGKTTLLALPEGTSFTKLKGIAVRTNGPSWQILVADAGTGSIQSLYVDPATPDFVTQTSVASTDFNAPSAIALSSDQASLFVADPQGTKLSVIDLTDNSVTPITFTGKLLSPASISLSTDGKTLYVADTGTKTLDTLPVAGGQIQSLAIEPSPALTCANCSFQPIAVTTINSGYLIVGDGRGRVFMVNTGGGVKAINFAGVAFRGVGGVAYSPITSKLVATTLNGAVVSSVS